MIFTDGSCVGPPDRRTGLRAGGWAAVIVRPGDAAPTFIAGGTPRTTNNRMELTAAIEALRAVPAGPGTRVTIVSDSRYLVEGMTLRLAPLKARGWKAPTGRRAPDRDLWQVLDALSAGRAIEWRWEKGHAGGLHNDRADELARKAAERQSRQA